MLFEVALNALSKLLHQMYYTVLIESIKETLRAQGLMTDITGASRSGQVAISG